MIQVNQQYALTSSENPRIINYGNYIIKLISQENWSISMVSEILPNGKVQSALTGTTLPSISLLHNIE